MIIAGGQLFGPIFQRHKFFTVPNTGVPVVEVSACGLKLAETLAHLQRTREPAQERARQCAVPHAAARGGGRDAEEVRNHVGRVDKITRDREEQHELAGFVAQELRRRCMTALALFAGTNAASAQDYPNRPIRFHRRVRGRRIERRGGAHLRTEAVGDPRRRASRSRTAPARTARSRCARSSRRRRTATRSPSRARP